MNQKRIILLFALVVFLFWWFSVRPIFIKIQCYEAMAQSTVKITREEAMKELNRRGVSFEQDKWYKKILYSKYFRILGINSDKVFYSATANGNLQYSNCLRGNGI